MLVLTLNNCNKVPIVNQNGETENNSNSTLNSEAMLEHILAFKEKMKYYKEHPGLKDGNDTYTADSAVWEMESLLNFNFCYTDVTCNKKKFSTSEVTMLLNSNDEITSSDLSDVYDVIIDTIKAQMNRLDYDSIKLLLVDLKLDTINSNGNAVVKVGSLVGSGNSVLHNDSWFYGENAGLCGNGNLAPEDAATQLDARVTNAMVPEPPNGCRWFYTDVVYEYINPTQDQLDPTPDNYLDYKIYYATTEGGLIIYDTTKCLSQYEMNTYENYYIEYAQDYETETGLKFDYCIITGNPYFEPAYHIQHDYFIYVGNRWLECDTGVGDIFN